VVEVSNELEVVFGRGVVAGGEDELSANVEEVTTQLDVVPG